MQKGNAVRTKGPTGLRFAVVVALSALSPATRAEAPAAAVSTFNQYAAKVELRLDREHGSPDSFVSVGSSADQARLRRGELIIENLTPAQSDLNGALLHDWRGTAFVAGATGDDFEHLMKNFRAYPQHFAPQVIGAKIRSPYAGPIPDRFTASMRVRQKHVFTVVMDTTYDVGFGRIDAQRGYSISRSTSIDEISSPGTKKERALTSAEDHGFLWRLNTYWTYEERDGGLYMQLESISLTRGIPTGLGWVVRPYVESVPRESLEFTLRATASALKDMQEKQERSR